MRGFFFAQNLPACNGTSSARHCKSARFPQRFNGRAGAPGVAATSQKTRAGSAVGFPFWAVGQNHVRLERHHQKNFVQLPILPETSALRFSKKPCSIMKLFRFIILPLFWLPLLVLGQQEAITTEGKKVVLYNNGTWQWADSLQADFFEGSAINNLEWPKTTPQETRIAHTGFSLSYAEQHEQAYWVAYMLTKERTNRLYDRTDRFLPDPKVATGTATHADYAKSGFDRGHLAPASDMGWSQSAMAESFYYSNISPQTPSFNRGIWKKLEELVRMWAVENDTLYVATGPVLTPNLPTIGPNRVAVPQYFYKVILDYSGPDKKGIGFILPNAASSAPLQSFAVTIDSVQQLTGINFFYQLPNKAEVALEKTICIACWPWQGNSSSRSPSDAATTTASQCNGLTKAGNRCNLRTTRLSGFCHLHDAQTETAPAQSPQRQTSVQCSGTTKAGNRCKRVTLNASGRCFQH